MTPIHFFFEFRSPYSYIASLGIEEVARAAGRTAEWRPVEIDAVWAAHGVLEAYAEIRRLKRSYVIRDAMRCAKMLGITIATPSASALHTSTPIQVR